MGTRAIITIEGTTVAVYKHYDGYPKSTLPWLEKFNQQFTEKRGEDPTYKVAQLLRDSIRSQEEFNLDPSWLTGWGVVNITPEEEPTYDMWQEYEYVLRNDGSVDAYSVFFRDGKKEKYKIHRMEPTT